MATRTVQGLGTLLVIASTATVSAQCDPQWLPGVGVPGTDQAVRALAVWDLDANGPSAAVLVMGGEFSIAGTTITSKIVAWDGAAGAWQPLGHGFNNHVRALTVFQGDLIAAGIFTMSGETPVSRIARWNATANQWQPIGNDTHILAVNALAVHNGRLIIAGLYQAPGSGFTLGCAAYDPTTNLWQPMGVAFSGALRTLMVHNGQLIVGGQFQHISTTEVNRIARWDAAASSWQPLGSGFNGNVVTLTELNGELIAGGDFTASGSQNVQYVARWDEASNQWQPFAPGLVGSARSLITFNEQVVASHLNPPFISTWDGAQWSMLGNPDLAPDAFAKYQGELYAGGGFGLLSGGVSCIARLDTGSRHWRPLIDVTIGFVAALAHFKGDVIAGGDFTSIEGASASRIARWDGTHWHSLSDFTNGSVWALGVFQNDLIVAGSFTNIGGVVGRIARWDGTSWHAMPLSISASINALVEYNGALIAAARWDESSYIIRWQGNEWSTIGQINSPSEFHVLAVYQDELYVGGSFSNISGVAASRIARWNGSSWHPVGDGISGGYAWPGINAMTIHDNELIVGGDFTTAGSVPVNNIARWNGTTWQPLGNGLAGRVYALTSHEGKLIAGGTFSVNGTLVNIGEWDGEKWQPLGSGIQLSPSAPSNSAPRVSALISRSNTLFAGGYFSLAGEHVSVNLARWASPQRKPGDVNCDTVVNVNDLLAVINSWGSCPASPSSCPADMFPTPNGDGVVNVNDLLMVINNWG